jgi:tRNA threonylcarbamoyl adenosine modification protein YeaZ
VPQFSRLLLAVDTSSSVVSAAVVDVRDDDVTLLAARDVGAANRHGELLAALVDGVLEEAGAAPADLTAVSAGLGPGPFTGLRVGVVTAASLADALGIPSYGVCSLDAIARAHISESDFLVCTDARRKQVYWAHYDGSGARTEGPDIATPIDVAARFAGEVPTAVGTGVTLYPDDFAAFSHTTDAAVSARDVAQLVADRVRAGAPSDVMEPMYLRRPDASPPGRPKSVLPV